MTEIGHRDWTYSAIDHHVYRFRLVNPATGTHDVVVSVSFGLVMSGISSSWTGVHQTTPNGTFVSADGNGTDPATVVASSDSGEVVVDAAYVKTPNEITPNHDFLTYRDLATGGFLMSQSAPGAASVTMSWTTGSNETWGTTAVPLKPVSASLLSGQTGAAVVTGTTAGRVVGTVKAPITP
jgi:hypothetical protein